MLISYNAVILCGGLGTRFRSVSSDKPKGLALVNGKPVLEILTDNLIRQGILKIVLCVGYLSSQIVEYFKNKKDANYDFSIEENSLGTGGAIRNALEKIDSDTFYVMNGDCVCEVDFVKFSIFHFEKKSFLSIVGSKISDSSEYGTLELNEDQKILSFNEKSSVGPGFINAGIYIMQKQNFDSFLDEEVFSLEKDLFPRLVSKFNCYSFLSDSEVIDIGTPQRYLDAQTKRKFFT